MTRSLRCKLRLYERPGVAGEVKQKVVLGNEQEDLPDWQQAEPRTAAGGERSRGLSRDSSPLHLGLPSRCRTERWSGRQRASVVTTTAVQQQHHLQVTEEIDREARWLSA